MNQDNGVSYGVLVVNWNDEEADSILLDFVNLGMAGNPYFNC